MRTRWNGQVVSDVVGNAGSVVLDDESTARRDLEDWLHDYYEIDDDEAETVAEHLTATVLTGAWWRCGGGWITDVEIAAEYLYAAAHEN